MFDLEMINYIESALNSCFYNGKLSRDYKYHHNISYKNTSDILINGILSISDLVKKGLISLSKEQLLLLADSESHANGIDGISLAIEMPIKTNDRYEIYDYSVVEKVDLLVDGDIKTRRCSTNYDNEFITYESILPSNIVSIDIRMLGLIKKYVLRNDFDKIYSSFNYLIGIAKTIINENMYVNLRDMSFSEEHIDVEKLSTFHLIK